MNSCPVQVTVSVTVWNEGIQDVKNNAQLIIPCAAATKRSVWGVMHAFIRVTRLPHAGVPVLGVFDS